MSTISFNDSFMSKARCYWPIRDFHKYTKNQLMSRQFSMSANKNIPLTWCLRIFSNGSNANCGDYISIHLSLLTDNIPEVEVKYEFSISNGEERRTNIHSYSSIFGPMKSFGCANFIKRDDLLNKANNLLVGNRLDIFCDITIFDIGYSRKNVMSKLTQDYQYMFENEKYWDIEFDLSGHNIRAHRNILASRSNVFAEMFDREMKEAQTDRVQIEDINHEVFKEMLHFIYTGEAPRLGEMPCDLLAAADKYSLEDLKIMCGEALCKNLSIEVAAVTLILADLHNCHLLKVHTIDFINSYAIEVMETATWQNMIKTHAHLIAEAYGAIAWLHKGFTNTCQMPFINIATQDDDMNQLQQQYNINNTTIQQNNIATSQFRRH